PRHVCIFWPEHHMRLAFFLWGTPRGLGRFGTSLISPSNVGPHGPCFWTSMRGCVMEPNRLRRDIRESPKRNWFPLHAFVFRLRLRFHSPPTCLRGGAGSLD